MTLRRHKVVAHQRGNTLVIGLIMLMLLTMLAVSTFHIGAVQTIAVSNAQHRAASIAAAQAAIETVINSSAFTNDPTQAITVTNCSSGGSNTLCVSSNGDSSKDFTVTLNPKPFCVEATPVAASSLDLSSGVNSTDYACLTGTQQDAFAVEGATIAGNSLCAQSVWEVTAVATDTSTSSVVTVKQGISERILTAQMSGYCPN
jgi:Tfp pilus assembly protein PilX